MLITKLLASKAVILNSNVTENNLYKICINQFLKKTTNVVCLF